MYKNNILIRNFGLLSRISRIFFSLSCLLISSLRTSLYIWWYSYEDKSESLLLWAHNFDSFLSYKFSYFYLEFFYLFVELSREVVFRGPIWIEQHKPSTNPVPTNVLWQRLFAISSGMWTVLSSAILYFIPPYCSRLRNTSWSPTP